MRWFIADEHYGHGEIIEYMNRPFSSVEDMTENLVQNHNSVVGKGDVTYHLGDFCWYSQYQEAEKIFKRLNGQHVFLRGDHDSWMSSPKHSEIRSVRIDIISVILCHYPIYYWPKSHFNSWHLHGHTHGDLNRSGKIICVSVEATGYYPLSECQISERMEKFEDNPNYIFPAERRKNKRL